MATVEDMGGTTRLKAMFERLRKELPPKIAQIGSQMALAASVRAPTPEDEYQVMMVGSGNPEGITRIPPMGSAFSDGDHRKRFIKDATEYLQPVILRNWQMIDPLVVGVGNMLILDNSSRYEWRDVDGSQWTSNFPFWECWEGGMSGTFEITPRHVGKSKRPTLKPGLGKENERSFMTKTIPRLMMYGGLDVASVIDDDLIPAIRNIVGEA